MKLEIVPPTLLHSQLKLVMIVNNKESIDLSSPFRGTGTRRGGTTFVTQEVELMKTLNINAHIQFYEMKSLFDRLHL